MSSKVPVDEDLWRAFSDLLVSSMKSYGKTDQASVMLVGESLSLSCIVLAEEASHAIDAAHESWTKAIDETGANADFGPEGWMASLLEQAEVNVRPLQTA